MAEIVATEKKIKAATYSGSAVVAHMLTVNKTKASAGSALVDMPSGVGIITRTKQPNTETKIIINRMKAVKDSCSV